MTSRFKKWRKKSAKPRPNTALGDSGSALQDSNPSLSPRVSSEDLYKTLGSQSSYDDVFKAHGSLDEMVEHVIVLVHTEPIWAEGQSAVSLPVQPGVTSAQLLETLAQRVGASPAGHLRVETPAGFLPMGSEDDVYAMLSRYDHLSSRCIELRHNLSPPPSEAVIHAQHEVLGKNQGKKKSLQTSGSFDLSPWNDKVVSVSSDEMPVERKKARVRDDDFYLPAELLAIAERPSRRAAFMEILERKYTSESFRCWDATTKFLRMLRNDTVRDINLRNESLASLVAMYVAEDGEWSVSLPAELHKNLLQAVAQINRNPSSPVDPRLLLSLQREMEVLLHSDVALFVRDNPLSDVLDERSDPDVVQEGLLRWRKVCVGKRARPTGTRVTFCSLTKDALWVYGHKKKDRGLKYVVHLAGCHFLEDKGSFSLKTPLFPKHLLVFTGTGDAATLTSWTTNARNLMAEQRVKMVKRQKDQTAILDSPIDLPGAVVAQRKLARDPYAGDSSDDDEDEDGDCGSTTATCDFDADEGEGRGSDSAGGSLASKASAPTSTPDTDVSSASASDVGRAAAVAAAAATTAADQAQALSSSRSGSPRELDDAPTADSSGPEVAEAVQDVPGEVSSDSTVTSAEVTQPPPPFGCGYGAATATAAGMLKLKRKQTSESGGRFMGYGAHNAREKHRRASHDSSGMPSPWSSPYNSPQAKSPYGQRRAAVTSAPKVNKEDDDDEGAYSSSTDMATTEEDDDDDLRGKRDARLGSVIHDTAAFTLLERAHMGHDRALMFDFSKNYGDCLQKLRAHSTNYNTTNTHLLHLYTQLIRISEDFLTYAKRYGRIIVSEVYLPPSIKTVKPLHIGGIIGGEKYVVHNILYKFAVDQEGVFGFDHSLAAKVAGHELKGLKSYAGTGVAGLNYPLVTLIDHKGFRIIATSVLPLGPGSLVYGSNDAGVTVHRDNPKLNRRIRKASALLNLKPHRCGAESTLVYSPLDLEGHVGVDGKFYLLDFSRTFPPSTPRRQHPNSHLYEMLRPEFVQRFALFPLCSDAYSKFVINEPDALEHQQEVDAATALLQGETVSLFASEVIEAMEKEVRTGEGLLFFPITQTLHRRGINVRLLGAVVRRMGRHQYTVVLLLEMIARIVKDEIRRLLRAKMAELKVPLDEPYRMAVTEYLNLVFARTSKSSKYWQKRIRSRLDTKFSLRPSNWRSFPVNLKKHAFSSFTFENTVFEGRFYLWHRVSQSTGLVVAPYLTDLLHSYPPIYDQPKIFDDTDIMDLGDRTKHLDVISNAKGFVFTARGAEKEQQGLHEAAFQLYLRALRSFELSLTSSPTDVRLLRNCARTLIKIDHLMRQPSATGPVTGPPATGDAAVSTSGRARSHSSSLSGASLARKAPSDIPGTKSWRLPRASVADASIRSSSASSSQTPSPSLERRYTNPLMVRRKSQEARNASTIEKSDSTIGIEDGKDALHASISHMQRSARRGASTEALGLGARDAYASADPAGVASPRKNGGKSGSRTDDGSENRGHPRMQLTPVLGQAENYYVKAIQSDYKDPISHYMYAQLLDALGRCDAAEGHYLIALSQDPNFLEALADYAMFLLTQRKSREMALMFHKRAESVSVHLATHVASKTHASITELELGRTLGDLNDSGKLLPLYPGTVNRTSGGSAYDAARFEEQFADMDEDWEDEQEDDGDDDGDSRASNRTRSMSSNSILTSDIGIDAPLSGDDFDCDE